jgi:hypothetical protein
MGKITIKKTLGIFMLVLFVASLTAASVSAGGDRFGRFDRFDRNEFKFIEKEKFKFVSKKDCDRDRWDRGCDRWDRGCGNWNRWDRGCGNWNRWDRGCGLFGFDFFGKNRGWDC